MEQEALCMGGLLDCMGAWEATVAWGWVDMVAGLCMGGPWAMATDFMAEVGCMVEVSMEEE